MPVVPKAMVAVCAARARSELKTAAMPSAPCRLPSSIAWLRPTADSAPGSQPVAMPRSLSSLVACFSKTI
jgi:hypothetical protein